MPLVVHAEQEELRRALGLEADNMLIADGSGDPQDVKIGSNEVVCRVGSADIDGLSIATNGFLARLGGDLQDFSIAANRIPLRGGSGNMAAELFTDSEVVGFPESGGLGVVNKSQLKDIVDVNEISTKTANYTVLGSERGTLFIANAADIVFTLPSTSADLWYTFVTRTITGSVGLSVSPAAADQIVDRDLTPVDDKDIINSSGSDVLGDYVVIVGDGDLGWYVVGKNGTWAMEV